MVVPVVAAAAARVVATEAVAGAAARTAATQAARSAATTSATNAAASTQRGASVARGATSKQSYAINQSRQQSLTQQATTDPGSEQSRIRTAAKQQVERQLEQVGNEREEQGPPPYVSKLDTGSFIGVLLIAVVIDVLQILFDLLVAGVITAIISYIAGIILGFIAYITIGLYLYLKGINLFSGRRLVISGLGFIADAAIAGLLPVWVITVVLIYMEEKAKERGISFMGLAKNIMK